MKSINCFGCGLTLNSLEINLKLGEIWLGLTVQSFITSNPKICSRSEIIGTPLYQLQCFYDIFSDPFLKVFFSKRVGQKVG